MVAGPGGATMERFILGAQKSTNQLKAVLAKLLPAAGGDRAGAGSSASAVDALLSDITDSLSQALTSLRLGALDTQRPTGQSSTIGGCGGSSRRLAARRSGQRARTAGECRMIVLQNGVQDSYTWRKYGQKEILGARFPRSYFKCGRKSGCSARKQVQQCDADPYKLEITYLGAHTCNAPPPPSSSQIVPDPRIISSGTQRHAADRLAPVVAATVPSASAQRCIGQPSPILHLVPDMLTAGVVLLPASAVVPAALPITQHDPVPDDDTAALTPSMGEEEGELLLFIPSPACSQSELLPTEVAKVESLGPPVWMEHDAAHDDVCVPISDFMVVPEV